MVSVFYIEVISNNHTRDGRRIFVSRFRNSIKKTLLKCFETTLESDKSHDHFKKKPKIRNSIETRCSEKWCYYYEQSTKYDWNSVIQTFSVYVNHFDKFSLLTHFSKQTFKFRLKAFVSSSLCTRKKLLIKTI